MYGWVGKILRVDLTTGMITEIPTSNYVPKYIGGRGIGAKIHWDEISPAVGAFDPQNILTFMTGPLAGTPATTGLLFKVNPNRRYICGYMTDKRKLETLNKYGA